MLGNPTLVAEVTHVSRHSLWLLLDAEELLVPFEHFPWFKKATIEQLSDVQWPTPVCIVHNAFGQACLFFIIPFHKCGVWYLISRATKQGRF